MSQCTNITYPYPKAYSFKYFDKNKNILYYVKYEDLASPNMSSH